MKKTTLSNKDIALQSAFTLFLTKGFLATSMDDIVAHSKVSKTNIYYYFKSKEELLFTIVNQLISYYEQQFNNVATKSENTVLDKLEMLLDLLSNNSEQNNYLAGCPFLTLYTQTPIEAVAIRDKIKSFLDQQMHVVELMLAQGVAKQELRADIPIQQTASLIVSSIEGALFLSQASNNPEIIKAIHPALALLLK